MCEFISWIEKEGQVFFLTYRDIYRTKRGKELREYCNSAYDYIGHGAIRFFYDNFKGGEEKECTAFSTPENFPNEIAQAIKNNEFNGVAPFPFPSALLTKKILMSIPTYIPLLRAHKKRVEALEKGTYREWEEACAEWEEAYLVWAKEETQKIAWNLFRDKQNRTPRWR